MINIAKLRMLKNKIIVGRNEWCELPVLHIPAIKAKVDTGAKTSALHAFNISTIKIRNEWYVDFEIHPIQGNDSVLIKCRELIYDNRYIMSSNGHKEHRYVIKTLLGLGKQQWEIELTLSNRDPLRYRMLLGREAINNRALIHPGIACYQGAITAKKLKKLYK